MEILPIALALRSRESCRTGTWESPRQMAATFGRRRWEAMVNSMPSLVTAAVSGVPTALIQALGLVQSRVRREAHYRARSMYMVASIPSTLPRLAARPPAFWKSVPQPAWISMRLLERKHAQAHLTNAREGPTIRTSSIPPGTHG